MRTKRTALVEALRGRFDDHHAELVRMLLDQIDALNGRIATLTARIEVMLDTMTTPAPVLDPTDRGAHDGPCSTGGLSVVERQEYGLSVSSACQTVPAWPTR
jgi:transposase